jgi:hypothetical protein
VKHLPFLMCVAEPSHGREVTKVRDVATSTDPLPAPLEADTTGYVLARATKKTAVRAETTDDR